MKFNLDYSDLVKLFEAYDEEFVSARIIADYITECINEDFDLSYYLHNTLLFNVKCFNTKAEAEKYMKEEEIKPQSCILWEGNFGVYLEKYS